MGSWYNIKTGKIIDNDQFPGIEWRPLGFFGHCQKNDGYICLAGNYDGICCPEDSCDIDDGIRLNPLLKENYEV